MKKILYILLLLPLLLTSCDGDIPDVSTLGILPSKQEKSRGLTVYKKDITQDGRTIKLYLERTGDTEGFDYTDSTQVKMKLVEDNIDILPVSSAAQPTLKSFTNVGVQELQRSGLFLNVLVDLTQPESILEMQKQHVYQMSKDFCQDNLYLTFMMADGKMSRSMLATPYVIENYISHSQAQYNESDSVGLPYLYRAVTKTIDEMEHSHQAPWNTATYKALVIFSDGVVYDGDNNLPLDPEHFQMQLRLIRQARHLPANFIISCIDLTPENIDPQVVDVNMMKMLCNRTHGQFYDSFTWNTVKNDIESAFNIRYPDYLVEIENPDGKIFLGNNRFINLKFCTLKDSVLTQAVTPYVCGSVYSPVTLGEFSRKTVGFEGFLCGFVTLVLIYFILQFIVPYIQYRRFRKKCVGRYEGKNMVLNTIKVPETCYYCKAPFKAGELIVAKCNHVMHEDCWNENDYQCPEHGSRCPEGSHYYNQNNLLDPKNATFYMKWILVSVFTGLLVWAAFIVRTHFALLRFAEEVLCSIFSIPNPNLDNPNPQNLNIMSPKMYYFVVFGIYITFILTFVISWLCSYHSKWYVRLRGVILRAVVATVLAFLAFIFEFVIIIFFQLYQYAILLDWIPWAFSALTIAYVSTFHSRINLPHKRLLISALGGILCTISWEMYGYVDCEREIVLLVFSAIIFCVAVAVTVATDMPRCEHFFLHVNGEIKEMDIALYKWINQTPESVAYIGRSIDCHLQITWDIKSEISSVHAVISHNHGAPTLATVDGDVYLNGKELKPDKQYRLYHGDTFQIGTTHFKFLDK